MYFAIWRAVGLLEYDVAGNYWKPYTDPDEENGKRCSSATRD